MRAAGTRRGKVYMSPKDIQDVPTDLIAPDELPMGLASLRLVAMWSGGAVSRELGAKERLVIGRGRDADVQIDHASVSRRHVILAVGGGSMAVEDLGSANGTWVDGRRIPSGGTVPVRPGVLIEIGKVLLVVHDHRVASEPMSPPTDGIVIADPEMVRVNELAALVAKSNLSVILLGETGVGKEVVAARVHRLSARASAPFLKINCAALVETLLEAELFGHERGAFTGAVQAKAGLLESAHGGTLFLDEIGEMPLATQAKLLRVLESGEVTRVGGVNPRKLDVRFVSATNRDLRDLSLGGRFRQDLFFRLDGASILIPPLRARRGEIPQLAASFLAEACRGLSRPPAHFAADANAALLAYGWPGNVRELRNVVARAALLAPGDLITATDLRFETLSGSTAPSLPPLPPEPPPAATDAAAATAAERARIANALDRAVGNQTRAAKLLGISRGTLLKRLDALGFPRPRRRDET